MDYHGNIEYILESPVDQDNITLRKNSTMQVKIMIV